MSKITTAVGNNGWSNTLVYYVSLILIRTECTAAWYCSLVQRIMSATRPVCDHPQSIHTLCQKWTYLYKKQHTKSSREYGRAHHGT